MIKNLCVFCSSSNEIASSLFKIAEDLGHFIAQRNLTLVYGGNNNGLMGKLAESVHRHGGSILGVILQKLVDKGLAYERADELIVTQDLFSRNSIMTNRADIFVALPGGCGTLTEILEVLTLRQLKFHNKPIVFLNQNGFYDNLFNLFERQFSEGFSKFEYREHYFVANDVLTAFAYIDKYSLESESIKIVE